MQSGLGCGGVLVVFVIFRVIVALVGSSTRESRPPVDPFQREVRPYTPETFTADEVDRFRRYERGEDVRGGRPALYPPPRYAEWARAGRPAGTPTTPKGRRP